MAWTDSDVLTKINERLDDPTIARLLMLNNETDGEGRQFYTYADGVKYITKLNKNLVNVCNLVCPAPVNSDVVIEYNEIYNPNNQDAIIVAELINAFIERFNSNASVWSSVYQLILD